MEMWIEHQQEYLEYARSLLQEKLSDRGLFVRNIKDFDQILLDIGKIYHDYMKVEEI